MKHRDEKKKRKNKKQKETHKSKIANKEKEYENSIKKDIRLPPNERLFKVTSLTIASLHWFS